MMTFGLNKPIFVFGLSGPGYILNYSGTNCRYLVEDDRAVLDVSLDGPFIASDAREFIAEDDRTLTLSSEGTIQYVTDIREFSVLGEPVLIVEDFRTFIAEDDTTSDAEDDRIIELERDCNA